MSYPMVGFENHGGKGHGHRFTLEEGMTQYGVLSTLNGKRFAARKLRQRTSRLSRRINRRTR